MSTIDEVRSLPRLVRNIMRRLMARTGLPVERPVLHALGLSGILMERLFFLFLLLFIHLGVFVACDNVQLPTLGLEIKKGSYGC